MIQSSYPVNAVVSDLINELAAVRKGRDVVVDLLFHEQDRRPYLASTLAIVPDVGLKRVQYVCLATDEEAARDAVISVVGDGFVSVKALDVAVMSRDCTVIDISDI